MDYSDPDITLGIILPHTPGYVTTTDLGVRETAVLSVDSGG